MVGTSQEKIETHEYTNKDVHDWNTVEKIVIPTKIIPYPVDLQWVVLK